MADSIFVLIAEHYNYSKVIVASKSKEKLNSLITVISNFTFEVDEREMNRHLDEWDNANPPPVIPPMPEKPITKSRKEHECSPEFMRWNEEYNKYSIDIQTRRNARSELRHKLEKQLLDKTEWPKEIALYSELTDYDYTYSIKEVKEI